VAESKPTSYEELADVLDNLPLLVREARRRRGLSVRATAKELGTSPSTVSRFENGDDIVLSHASVIVARVYPHRPRTRRAPGCRAASCYPCGRGEFRPRCR
jgi:DNA-binding transcriptional regulator YiaG